MFDLSTLSDDAIHALIETLLKDFEAQSVTCRKFVASRAENLAAAARDPFVDVGFILDSDIEKLRESAALARVVEESTKLLSVPGTNPRSRLEALAEYSAMKVFGKCGPVSADEDQAWKMVIGNLADVITRSRKKARSGA